MCFSVFAAASCSEALVKPGSGGAPYSVEIVGDGGNIVAGKLDMDFPCLPQAEPMFDVTVSRLRSADKSMRLARNLIIVRIDPEKFKETSVAYELDAYARPQMVVYVNAPSKRGLAEGLSGAKLARLLNRHEMGVAVSRLRKKHNLAADSVAASMFGYSLLVGSDMVSMKRGRGFLWVSNNSPYGMVNVCVYDSENRDSVMRENIKGETDRMFMRTVAGSTRKRYIVLDGNKVVETRGLWEMEGDAMGGPFVSHAFKDQSTGRTLVAEAFVYAPGRSKRNLLNQGEASLYTLEKVRAKNIRGNKR